MQAKQLWQTVLSDMERRLSRSAFENWLRQTSIIGFEDDVATVATANTFSASTLESRYASEIERVLSSIVGREVGVRFTVLNADTDDDLPPRPARKDPAPPALRPARQENDPARDRPVRRDPVPLSATNIPTRQLELTPAPAHGLNPRYVYEHYVVGSSNRFAHAASQSVAEKPGGNYNPFFIYGGVGLGKTHLLHAIGHRALELRPDLTVVYVSSEMFTNDVINAIRAQRMDDFRNRYRTIDILMIDDIQFIGNKDATQEEFFHTFNALHQNGKQVVISADKPPKAIGGLEERLRSRFEGGLIADVQLPDYEMRTAILRAKGEEIGVPMAAEVIEYVAQRDQSNIRELEGALNKIFFYAEMNGRPISLQLAMEALTDAGSGARREKASPETVLRAVSAHFDLPLADMRGRSRSKEIVVPRQIAMFLLRDETALSLVEIGQMLGGRDHTTAMHSIEKIERELQRDMGLRSHIMKIRESLISSTFD